MKSDVIILDTPPATIEVPEEYIRLAKMLMNALAGGHVVHCTLMTPESKMSLQEAATFLDMPRTEVVRLGQDGIIPFEEEFGMMTFRAQDIRAYRLEQLNELKKQQFEAMMFSFENEGD